MLDDGSVASLVLTVCISMTPFRVARKRKMLVWQTGGTDRNSTQNSTSPPNIMYYRNESKFY